jgi:hypothetical protein
MKSSYNSPCDSTLRRFSSLHAFISSGSRATEVVVERLSSPIHGCSPLAKQKCGRIHIVPEGPMTTCQTYITYGVATFRDKSTIYNQRSRHSSSMASSFPIVGPTSTTGISTQPLNMYSSPGPIFATVQVLPGADSVSSICFTLVLTNELETEAVIVDASEISRADWISKLDTSR